MALVDSLEVIEVPATDQGIGGVELLSLYGEDDPRISAFLPGLTKRFKKFARRARKVTPHYWAAQAIKRRRAAAQRKAAAARHRKPAFLTVPKRKYTSVSWQNGTGTVRNARNIRMYGEEEIDFIYEGEEKINLTPLEVELLGMVEDGLLSGEEVEALGAFLPGLKKFFKKASNVIAKFDPTSQKAPIGRLIKKGLSVGANIVLPGSGILVSKGLSAASQLGKTLRAKGQSPQQIFTEIRKAGFDPAIATRATAEATYVKPKSPFLQTIKNPAVFVPAAIGLTVITIMLTKKQPRPVVMPSRQVPYY